MSFQRAICGRCGRSMTLAARTGGDVRAHFCPHNRSCVPYTACPDCPPRPMPPERRLLPRIQGVEEMWRRATGTLIGVVAGTDPLRSRILTKDEQRADALTRVAQRRAPADPNEGY